MEIMYTNKLTEYIKSNKFVAIYGDKIGLINNGMTFYGISYDDEWTVKRFLNGYKLKVNTSILNLFNELEVNIKLLNKKIKYLSKGQLKLVLLMHSLLNKKDILVFDYFDKGLSFKIKKRIINYLKTRYEGTLIVISNDLVFLNQLCNYLIIFKNNKIIFNDIFDNLYKKNIKIDYPEIINFIKLANKSKAKLSYTVETHELLKDIYRSIK